MNSAIEVRELIKKYPNVTAVNNINFEVKQGEIFGFLGPNGAGKTTTQRILTGIIPPTEGEASVLGYNMETEAFHAKSQIGVVPEMANIYIDLSAWDNSMLIGSLYGVSKRIRMTKTKELFKVFNLYERKDQKARFFSKGMKQRLLLCTALMHNPKILFLDEPTTGLDVESSRLIREMISQFNKQGITIFLITHNIAEADELCDRIAIIDHGKIAAIDKPENLKRAFQSVQVVEVAFNESIIKIEGAILGKIKGINKAQKAGDKLKFYTDNPDELIAQIIDFSRERNLKVIALNTLGPDLEEVFVKITDEHMGWNYEEGKSNFKSA